MPSYKYTAFKKPSHDIISAFFWLWFFSNYSISCTGNIVVLTENRNHGDQFTSTKEGKSSLYLQIHRYGSKFIEDYLPDQKLIFIIILLSEDNILKAYPSFALRYQFK
jgi:hypothetical protein